MIFGLASTVVLGVAAALVVAGWYVFSASRCDARRLGDSPDTGSCARSTRSPTESAARGRERPDTPEDTPLRCPKCRQINDSAARFCARCGRELISGDDT